MKNEKLIKIKKKKIIKKIKIFKNYFYLYKFFFFLGGKVSDISRKSDRNAKIRNNVAITVTNLSEFVSHRPNRNTAFLRTAFLIGMACLH